MIIGYLRTRRNRYFWSSRLVTAPLRFAQYSLSGHPVPQHNRCICRMHSADRDVQLV